MWFSTSLYFRYAFYDLVEYTWILKGYHKQWIKPTTGGKGKENILKTKQNKKIQLALEDSEEQSWE